MPSTGSHSENLFSLQTFGIPTECIVPDEDGKATRTTTNTEFWEKRRLHERAAVTDRKVAAAARVLCTPRSNDVLFGRGRALQLHPGNMRYRELIEQTIKVYDEASVVEKTKMTAAVVGAIKRAKGRFLKREGDGSWIEVDDDVARFKASHSFRSTRRASKVKTIKKSQVVAEVSHNIETLAS